VAAARQRDVGGSGTVRECADTHTFKRHRRANVRVFVLGRGWMDNSVDSMVVVGSYGVARGNVHRGRQWAAATNDVADGDANDIIC
jgi:hypothetical protein